MRRRLIAIGDHHFNERARFDECKRVHRWVNDLIAADPPDLCASGGDVFHAGSTQRERDASADFFVGVGEHCPVMIAGGNHDGKGEVAFMRRLRSKYPIVTEESAGVYELGGIAVAAVGWPSAASLAAHTGLTLAHMDAGARTVFRDVLRALGRTLAKHDGPRVVLGHFMVNGSRPSVGQPLIGVPLNIELPDLAHACAPLVLMSHIHRAQEWRHGDMVAAYMGSPYRTDFGETETKSILRATFEDDRLVDVERIDTPCRPMHLISGRWNDGTMHVTLPAPVELRNADVRVRYKVKPDTRAAGRRGAQELRDRILAMGAATVKLEADIEAPIAARAPEVAAATSTAEQLLAVWRHRGILPDALRERRLMAMLTEIEAEA